jgi:hypothetical protein
MSEPILDLIQRLHDSEINSSVAAFFDACLNGNSAIG